jgi:hypothetical protein
MSYDNNENNQANVYGSPNQDPNWVNRWDGPNIKEYKNAVYTKISELLLKQWSKIEPFVDGEGFEGLQKTYRDGKLVKGRIDTSSEMLVVYESDVDANDDGSKMEDSILTWLDFVDVNSIGLVVEEVIESAGEDPSPPNLILRAPGKIDLNLNEKIGALELNDINLKDNVSQFMKLDKSKTNINRTKLSEHVDTQISELSPITFTQFLERYNKLKRQIPIRYRSDDFFVEYTNSNLPLGYRIEKLFEEFERIKGDIPCGGLTPYTDIEPSLEPLTDEQLFGWETLTYLITKSQDNCNVSNPIFSQNDVRTWDDEIENLKAETVYLTAENQNKQVTILELQKVISNFSCDEDDIIGCTDPTATNYNPAANADDGSCIYDVVEDIFIPKEGVNIQVKGTGLNNPSPRLLEIDGDKIYNINRESRGLRLTVFSEATLRGKALDPTVILTEQDAKFDKMYDVYNTTNPNYNYRSEMARAIFNLPTWDPSFSVNNSQCSHMETDMGSGIWHEYPETVHDCSTYFSEGITGGGPGSRRAVCNDGTTHLLYDASEYTTSDPWGSGIWPLGDDVSGDCICSGECGNSWLMNDVFIITSYDAVGYDDLLVQALKSIGGCDPRLVSGFQDDDPNSNARTPYALIGSKGSGECGGYEAVGDDGSTAAAAAAEITKFWDFDQEGEGIIGTTQTDIIIAGCTDPTATNFNASAEEDDGTCLYETVVFEETFDDWQDSYSPSNYWSRSYLGQVVQTDGPLGAGDGAVRLYRKKDLGTWPGALANKNDESFSSEEFGFTDRMVDHLFLKENQTYKATIWGRCQTNNNKAAVFIGDTRCPDGYSSGCYSWSKSKWWNTGGNWTEVSWTFSPVKNKHLEEDGSVIFPGIMANTYLYAGTNSGASPGQYCDYANFKIIEVPSAEVGGQFEVGGQIPGPLSTSKKFNPNPSGESHYASIPIPAFDFSEIPKPFKKSSNQMRMGGRTQPKPYKRKGRK